MASTYSSLKFELIATGEQAGTWGGTTNTNIGTAIQEAITGSADVAFTSADVTLTLTDTNASQTARNLRLNLTGTSGGARNLIVPTVVKQYIVNNGLADAVTVKNSTGTGIAVPAGKTMIVFNNATNVVDVTNYASSLTLGSALPVASGGTGLTSGTSGGVLYYSATGTLASSALLTQYGIIYGGGAGAAPVATAAGTTGQILSAVTGGAPIWSSTYAGTVTSVSFTGGIISVATGTTTPAFTVAGTSGGIPYFSSGTTWATSAALAANAIVLGGGAGAAPATTTTGTGVVTALGVNVGSAGAFTTNNAANTFTANQTFYQVLYTVNTVTVTSNAGTVPITYRLNNFTNSSAATMTITMATASAVDGQMSIVRIYDSSAVAQTITWVNTENSSIAAPTTSNGSTTLPLTVGFMYNSQTLKWRCVASA